VPPRFAEDNLADFLVWRVWCVAEQAAQRQERPLLSLPTWPDGRIDPAELARRVNTQPRSEWENISDDRASLFHLDLGVAIPATGPGIHVDGDVLTDGILAGKIMARHRLINDRHAHPAGIGDGKVAPGEERRA